MAPTPPSRERRLSYDRRVLCCAHEVAPGDHGVAEAEMIVGGFSFCYPCGQSALAALLEPPGAHTIREVLREYQDGIREISP
jgi:hypothetical protein